MAGEKQGEQALEMFTQIFALEKQLESAKALEESKTQAADSAKAQNASKVSIPDKALKMAQVSI
ncbi:hypothetical protein D3C81_1181720 [compost metagenome]